MTLLRKLVMNRIILRLARAWKTPLLLLLYYCGVFFLLACLPARRINVRRACKRDARCDVKIRLVVRPAGCSQRSLTTITLFYVIKKLSVINAHTERAGYAVCIAVLGWRRIPTSLKANAELS